MQQESAVWQQKRHILHIFLAEDCFLHNFSNIVALNLFLCSSKGTNLTSSITFIWAQLQPHVMQPNILNHFTYCILPCPTPSHATISQGSLSLGGSRGLHYYLSKCILHSRSTVSYESIHFPRSLY